MKLEHTREEYEAHAEEVKQTYFEAEDRLNVKLKPYEAEISEIDRKIAEAETNKGNVKRIKSHRIWLVFAIVFTVIAEVLYTQYDGGVNALAVIGYGIAAVALICLLVFFVKMSKNKKAYRAAQYEFDALIAKLEEDKLAFGSDDPEVVELRKIMADCEEEYAACLKLINESIIQETLGGNGVIVWCEKTAIIHYKSSVGNMNVLPQQKKVGCDAVVKIDGVPRGSATSSPLFVPVPAGLHNYSVEFQLPESFDFFDEHYTLPNGGYCESKSTPIKFEGDVQYFVYRNLHYKKGLEWEIYTSNNHVAFCEAIGVSVDDFMEYIQKL